MLITPSISSKYTQAGTSFTVNTQSSGAMCRSILAIVGPSGSGKSVLLAAIANRIYRPARAGGEVLVNGMRLRSSSIEPTYLAADDELLWGLTVEQTLTYTGTPAPLFPLHRLKDVEPASLHDSAYHCRDMASL